MKYNTALNIVYYVQLIILLSWITSIAIYLTGNLNLFYPCLITLTLVGSMYFTNTIYSKYILPLKVDSTRQV